MRLFACGEGLDISFIEEMPLGQIHGRSNTFISSEETRALLAQQFELIPSTFVPTRVLALETAAIVELEHAPDWRAGPRHDLGDVAVSTLVELDAEHWLIGNWRGHPLLVTRSEDTDGVRIAVQSLADRGMVGPADGGSSVWQLHGKTYATLGDALYEIDPQGVKPPRKIMEGMGGLNGFQFGNDDRV